MDIDQQFKTGSIDCPLCDHPIPVGHSRCRCGWRIPSASTQASPFFPALFLPVIPILGSLWLIYLILNPSLLWFTLMPLIKAVGVTFIASAALVVVIADRADRENWQRRPGPFEDFAPATWFVSVLVLGPVTYCIFAFLYFWDSAKVRVLLSLLASAGFVIGLLWIVFTRSQPMATTASRPDAESHGITRPTSNNVPANTDVPAVVPPIDITIGEATSPSTATRPVPASAVTNNSTSLHSSPAVANPTPWIPPQAPPIPSARSTPSRSARDNPDSGVDILKAR